MAQLNSYETGDSGAWGRMHRGHTRSWSHEEEENDWSRLDLPPSRPLPHRRRGDPIPRPAKSAYAAPPSTATSHQRPAVTRCASVLFASPSGMRHHNSDTPLLGRHPAVPSIPRAATAPTGNLSFQQQNQQSQQNHQYQQYQQYQRSPSGSRRAPSQRDLSPQYRSTPVSRRSMRSSLGESDNETDLTRPTPEDDEDDDFAGPARSVFAERPSLRDRLGGATKRPSQDFTSSSSSRQKPPRKQKSSQPKNQIKQKHARADLGVDDDADEATFQNDIEREHERDRESSILQQQAYSSPPQHSHRHPSRGRSTRGLRREDSIREEIPREERQADANTEMDKVDFSDDRRRTRRQQTPPRRTRRSQSQNPGDSRGISRSKSRVRARDADEFNPRASSRRPTKRYCETEIPDYAGSPATLRRAQTHGPASHVNASSSIDSPKRPASLFESTLDNGSYTFPAEKPNKRATCFSCKDELSPSRMTNLECGHWLCSRCLKQRFKNSLTDSRQMPPTCCSNPIPVKHVDKHFDPVFKRDWNERHYEVSLGNRMYCFKCGSTVSADSRFRDGSLGEIAQCDRCRTKLCVRCHHKAHKSSACPSDPKIERSLDKYRKEGRQHCHKCRTQVDYHDGRNRLNCEQCNAESCMICGGRWGFCNCPVFNVDSPEQAHVDYDHSQFAPGFVRHDRYASAPPAPAPFPTPAASMAPTQRDFRGRNRSTERPFSAGRPMRSRAQSFDEKSRVRSRADDFRVVEDLSRRLDYRPFNETMHNDDDDDDDDDTRTEAYARSVYKSRFDTQRSRQPSRTRAEDDFAIRPRRRRSFVVDDFERAETDILPSVPQPPPAIPSPPQQKAQAESIVTHRQQFHHQQHPQHQQQHPQHPQHQQHQHQQHQHQQHQSMPMPQPDMHAYQPPHMQHMHHPQHPQHMQAPEPRPRPPIAPSQHPGDFYNGTPPRQRPAAHVDSDVGRLADRFNKDPRSSPMHRSTQQPPPQAQGLPSVAMGAPMQAPMLMGMPAPPTTLMGSMPTHMPQMIGMGPQGMPQPPQSIHPMAMMSMQSLPPVDHMSGMRMGMGMLPYMMEDNSYAQSELAAMYPGSQVPFTDSSRPFESPDADVYTTNGGMSRRLRRREDAQQNHLAKPSEMAGLGRYGRGMDRVSEWRAYVSADPPDETSTIASSVEAA